MIPLEMGEARKAILSLPSIDSDARELESEYPGIWASIWTTIEPEMLKSVEADYPKFWSALEELYVSRLSEAEARALLAFYRSPTGQKLLRSVMRNFDGRSAFTKMVQSDSGTLSAVEIKGAADKARSKAVQQMGPEDRPALLALARSVDLEKFQAVGRETQQLTLAWVNKEEPEADARLQKLMMSAMEDYIAKHPAKK